MTRSKEPTDPQVIECVCAATCTAVLVDRLSMARAVGWRRLRAVTGAAPRGSTTNRGWLGFCPRCAKRYSVEGG